ncbi:MAG TPA: hypothetical protein VFG05_08280 [Methylocella sp.]|nr:hypothetical protein [Methylocella sp.]
MTARTEKLVYSEGPIFDVERYPLIVFVHVPKTGGSTVNELLLSCSHRGRKDCHLIPGLKLESIARSSDWLSGHIERNRFSHALAGLDRPIEYFATVREPVAQLVSHLNFQFEIYYRGPLYFFRFPRIIQLMSEQVRSTDFSKAESIIALLQRFKGFLNLQARMVLGADYSEISGSETERRLAAYTYIALNENLESLYPAFGFARLPERVGALRENEASKYHFDPAIFQSEEIQSFLAEHHAHDFRLYERIRKISWPAESRRPCRPVFLQVTKDNYDEEAYLAFNPDVAIALKGHRTWRIGYDHYKAHGHAEPRRQVFLPE